MASRGRTGWPCGLIRSWQGLLVGSVYGSSMLDHKGFLLRRTAGTAIAAAVA